MDITTFDLEKWYVRYEFSSKYNLSASGIKPVSLNTLTLNHDLQSIPLGYSPAAGSSELRQTLSEIYSVSPDEVLVTNGAIEAIFLAQMALVSKGDKVITVKPSYPALYQVAEDIGAKVIEWPLEFSNTFRPDLTKLESLLEEHHPAMLVINFPNNPTGICLTEEQLEKICFLSQKYNCHLLSDEIYKDLSFEQPVKNAYSLFTGKAISISSLSKSYGLPGLRIGWMIASPEIISKCTNLRHYTSLCCNFLGEVVGTEALKNSKMLVDKAVGHARKNYLILKTNLEKWCSEFNLDYIEPQAGVMVFIRLKSLKDTEQFCIDFEKATSILLLPGNKYGENYSQFIRLGYGGDTEDFIYCLNQFETFLEHYSF